MGGGWRLSRGAPGMSRSGSRQPTGRTHASSPTTCGSGQAHRRGRRTDARSRSTAATSASRFASGPSTRMAARRARSRAGPATSRCRDGRRDGKWIYFSKRSGIDAEYLARARVGWRAAASDADGQRLRRLRVRRRHQSPYQPVNGDSALLLMPLTGAAGPRHLVDCVRSSCVRSGREHSRLRAMRSEREAATSRNRSRQRKGSSPRDDSRTFLPGRCT